MKAHPFFQRLIIVSLQQDIARLEAQARALGMPGGPVASATVQPVAELLLSAGTTEPSPAPESATHPIPPAFRREVLRSLAGPVIVMNSTTPPPPGGLDGSCLVYAGNRREIPN